MIKALVILLALAPVSAGAQDYVMYETQYLKVKPGETKQFNEGMKAHNERFHGAGPYHATVWFIVNGPRSGQVFWAMGPTTFTHLDDRPSGEAHESDWAENVLSHAEQGESEYWRRDEDLSQPTDEVAPILRVRIYDIKDFEGYRFDQLQEKIKQVLEAKHRPHQRQIFRNVSWSGTGRDVVSVRSLQKWADLDAESTFVKDYEEVHGAGSWAAFMNEWKAVVIHTEEEFHQLIPELSVSLQTSNE